MIGLDFPKIEFELFGLELLEPMAIITDSIMGGLSVYFGLKIRKLKVESAFCRLWTLFFIVFGIGAILGGIGHTFYNQLGLFGKIPSWLFGPISIYLAETAMISMHWNHTFKKKLYKWYNAKLLLVYLAFLYLLIFKQNPNNPTLPFLPIAINTIVGMVSTVGILGYLYTKKLAHHYRYFWLGVIVMFPSAIIFLLKINVHQWFDKNDFSHVLITIGLIYWYLGISKLVDDKQFEQV